MSQSAWEVVFGQPTGSAQLIGQRFALEIHATLEINRATG